MNDILIVEDNKEISGLLSDLLRAENYIVTAVDNGEKALSVFERYGARLVLLDIMLPGIDGFYVCEKIRKTSDTPIIILSAKVDKDDKLNGLILGADDYMEKPYDIDILLAKIQGIFKRRYAMDEITCGELVLNKIEKTVTKKGKSIEVRAKEFDLLLL
ncbi:MAG: response regulator transcription factor, partial [Lachnospiraceae bacterium]|nr:response regulator transcription factor [Lachnospiraceae bacterium]